MQHDKEIKNTITQYFDELTLILTSQMTTTLETKIPRSDVINNRTAELDKIVTITTQGVINPHLLQDTSTGKNIILRKTTPSNTKDTMKSESFIRNASQKDVSSIENIIMEAIRDDKPNSRSAESIKITKKLKKGCNRHLSIGIISVDNNPLKNARVIIPKNFTESESFIRNTP